MKTLIICLASLAAGVLAGGLLFAYADDPHPREVSHHHVGPTLERVQRLARLVTLNVPIADVQTSRLEGYTGSASVVIVVKGDVEIGTDLSRATFDSLDAERRCAVLILSQPTFSRPRLDHERTFIYRIDRTGLWKLPPGDGGQRDLINAALREAQRLLAAAAQQSSLIDQSRRLTEEILRGLFEACGWRIEIRWMAPSDEALAASFNPTHLGLCDELTSTQVTTRTTTQSEEQGDIPCRQTSQHAFAKSMSSSTRRPTWS